MAAGAGSQRAMSTDNARSVHVRNLPLLPVVEMEDLLYELFLQVITNNYCFVCV